MKLELDPAKGSAFLISYELASGGSPFNFSTIFSSSPLLWVWLLIFRIASWLIVPVLAATAVDAAFRAWDQRRSDLAGRLSTHMEGVVTRNLGVSSEEANKIATEARQFLEDQLRRLRS